MKPRLSWWFLNLFGYYPDEQVRWSYSQLIRLMYRRDRKATVAGMPVRFHTISQPTFQVDLTGDHFHLVRQKGDLTFYEPSSDSYSDVVGYPLGKEPMLYRKIVCDTAKLPFEISEIGDE